MNQPLRFLKAMALLSAFGGMQPYVYKSSDRCGVGLAHFAAPVHVGIEMQFDSVGVLIGRDDWTTPAAIVYSKDWTGQRMVTIQKPER